MKFTEILEELRKGKKVTREKWEKPGDSCAIDFIMYDQKKDKCEFYRDGKYYDEFVWIYEDIIAEDWKIYQEKENNKSWKPKEGDTIFYIIESGRVISGSFLSLLPSDNDKVLFNNAFQTREEAEHMLEKIKIINKLRELSNISFNDNCKQEKFVIFYNTENQQIRITQHTFIREIPFNIYFKTEEDCQNVIETIGEDNLKKYYFDVED